MPSMISNEESTRRRFMAQFFVAAVALILPFSLKRRWKKSRIAGKARSGSNKVVIAPEPRAVARNSAPGHHDSAGAIDVQDT